MVATSCSPSNFFQEALYFCWEFGECAIFSQLEVMFCWNASAVSVAFLYLLNIPTVNNLTVCHPRRHRPVLSARMEALLKKTQADFTPTKSARRVSVRHFLLIKAFCKWKTTYVRCWLQLWPVHRCFSERGCLRKWSCFLEYHNARQHNRLLTYGCTVRRCDLQTEYNSQEEQPHRHLPSSMLCGTDVRKEWRKSWPDF